MGNICIIIFNINQKKYELSWMSCHFYVQTVGRKFSLIYLYAFLICNYAIVSTNFLMYNSQYFTYYFLLYAPWIIKRVYYYYLNVYVQKLKQLWLNKQKLLFIYYICAGLYMYCLKHISSKMNCVFNCTAVSWILIMDFWLVYYFAIW